MKNNVSVVGYGLKRVKEKGMITLLNPASANRAIAEFFRIRNCTIPTSHSVLSFSGRNTYIHKSIFNVSL